MSFLNQKEHLKVLFGQLKAVFLLILLTVKFLLIASFIFILIVESQSICPFPTKGNYNLNNTCLTTSTTGIEEGRLNVPVSNLNIASNTNFIYNPGYGIDLGIGLINFQGSGAPGNIKKGYLCVQDDDDDGCWLNPTFSTSSTCSATNLKRYSNFAASFPTNYWGDCNDNSNQQCYLLNEVCGDDIDNDCDGLIDEGCYFGCLGMPAIIRPSAVAYNNKIYYLGGMAFQEYDPATNNWTILPFPSHLFFSISDHSAVVYQDKMYVVGGAIEDLSGWHSTSAMFVYDFILKSWQIIPRTYGWPEYINGSATVLDNKMYIYGVVGNSLSDLDSLYSYNFSLNQWTKLPNFYSQTGLSSIGGIIVADPTRGKIYLYGGEDIRNFAQPIAGHVYSFNINTNTYLREYEDISYVVTLHSVVRYQNKLYVLVGRINGEPTGQFKAFDLDTKTWEDKSRDILARLNHTAVVVGSKMYVFGGTDSSNEVLHDLRIYDFNSDTWSKGSFGPVSRYNHSAVVYNNKMYIYGGQCGPNEFPRRDLKSFDFQSNSWTYEPSGPRYKDSHSAVVFNNKMYLWGNGSSFINYPSQGDNDYYMLVYDFLNKTWSSYISPPGMGYLQRFKGGKNRYAYIVGNKMYKAGEYSYRNFSEEDSRLNHKKLLECTLEPVPSCDILETGPNVVDREDGYSTTYFNNQRYIYGGTGCNLRTGICDDRAYHSAVLKANKLYIFGGVYGGILSSLKMRDMVTGVWTTLVSDSIPRYGHSAVIYEDEMYVVEGKTTNEVPLGDTRIYNINSNTWQAGIPEPQR